MKDRLRLIVSVFLLVFLAGCTSPAPPGTLEPEPMPQQSEPAPDQSGIPEAEEAPVACDQITKAAIEDTVNFQTRAFAANNYDLAYSFASPGFRSSVTLENFVEIIAGSYGPLIESSDLRFSDCLANPNGGLALIDVSFLQAGKFVYALRYLMVETSDGWRVEGASNLRVVGEGT